MANHNEPLENVIRSLMSSSFGIEESSITSDIPFTELPIDSLDAVNFMMECEAAFSVNIPDEDAEQILTLRDAVAVITRLLSAKRDAEADSTKEARVAGTHQHSTRTFARVILNSDYFTTYANEFGFSPTSFEKVIISALGQSHVNHITTVPVITQGPEGSLVSCRIYALTPTHILYFLLERGVITHQKQALDRINLTIRYKFSRPDGEISAIEADFTINDERTSLVFLEEEGITGALKFAEKYENLLSKHLAGVSFGSRRQLDT